MFPESGKAQKALHETDAAASLLADDFLFQKVLH
jgi:hypothetical protein